MGFINPFSSEGYFGRIVGEFGIRYFLIISMVYGMNQAIAYTWGRFARAYWFADTVEQGGLNYTPAETDSVNSLANIPWQIKAIYGILSDAFAIRNYHRKYYILIATIMGAVGWATLGLIPSPSKAVVIIFLFMTNVSIAMPDVMVDASVAENCQKHPAYAVDLQSTLWGAYGIGAACANLSAGFLQVEIGSRTLLAITAFVPMTIILPVAFNWLNEEPDYEWRVPRDKFLRVFKDAFSCGNSLQDFDEYRVSGEGAAALEDRKAEVENDRQQGKLYILALILCAVAIVYGLIANTIESTAALFGLYIASCSTIIGSLYIFEKGISMDLVRASIYIFLSGAVIPRASVLTYWLRDRSGNCCEEAYATAVSKNQSVPDFCDDADFVGRPCVEDEFVSAINVVGNMMMVVGIVIYNKWLSHMSYRKIWTISQVAFLVTSMHHWVWVNRWNIDWGISDKVIMVSGGEVIDEIISRFDSMPFFILAAKLCPAGLEGTLFAMIMGLSNFGVDMGYYLGAILLTVLGCQQDDYENLSEYILIRNASSILIIISIPFLVPKGSPQDPSPYYQEDGEMTDEEFKRKSIEEEVVVERAKRFSMEK